MQKRKTLSSFFFVQAFACRGIIPRSIQKSMTRWIFRANRSRLLCVLLLQAPTAAQVFPNLSIILLKCQPARNTDLQPSRRSTSVIP